MIAIFTTKTVTANLPGFAVGDGCWVTMLLTGTIGSGTVKVQTSEDNGTTWEDFVPLTDGATGTVLTFSKLGQIRAWFAGQYVRFVYTAGGGSSLTLKATGDFVLESIGSASRP